MGTYTNNKNLKKPNDNDEIWRYMDFTKFVSMLHYKSIHFTRVDKLKDPYDTSIASFFVEHTDLSQSLLKKIMKLEARRKKLFVSCWHINNYTDSAALWKVYMKSDEGIAIQTTVKKLISVLEASAENIPFDLVSVNYDTKKLFFKTNRSDGKILWTPKYEEVLFTKRSCFQHENELRIILAISNLKSTGFDWRDLDMNLLIESIRVNPEAPTWIVSLVRDLAKNYNIDCETLKSKIYHCP